MDASKVNPLICNICEKEFTSVSVKNRHLRTIHNDESAKVVKKQHILCSLCTTHEKQETFPTYDHLHDHLRKIHDVLIKQSVLIFRNREEFETWRGKENREVDYVLTRTKTLKGETVVNYYCNRSNYRGYESVCSKRNMKVRGSIHIQGICPSRFTAIISKDGSYTVTFVETHVGHDDDLGTKRLSKSQQHLLVEKLATGITSDRIIQDARKIQDDKLERLNIITRGDLAYLVRKYNFNKKRHPDDMVATAMKVDEWNKKGNNYAFLFKKIALKLRFGGSIEADFFMSDDDPKYFNAWRKVMNPVNKLRRLLCTWHVIKNWNIQGKSKIKKLEIRDEMKKEMRIIMKETDPTKFLKLKDNYFRKLANEGEDDFLKYLQNYYFQTEERIMMWAHCYRINVGINTNMAIESLNKILKYHKIKGQRNIRVEKLLDLLDELVEERMWTRIINVERPNSNNYQYKITMEQHKKAEKIDRGKIEINEFGKFKVPSGQVCQKSYTVSCKLVCDIDCRAGFCNLCKVCIHRYECDCSENAVKKVLCKHIHAVSMLEARSETVVGSPRSDDDDNLIVNEPTGSRLCYQDDVNFFIQEIKQHNTTTTFEDRKKIAKEEFDCFVETLTEDDFEKFMTEFQKIKNNIGHTEHVSKKRRVEKQSYFPNKK